MALTLFIPSNIDLVSLSDSASKVIHAYKQDKLVYLLDLFNRKGTGNFKWLYNLNYTPGIHSSYLKSMIFDYSKYTSFLKDEGIIKFGSYVPGDLSREYEFLPTYKDVKLQAVEINDLVLLQNIAKKRNNNIEKAKKMYPV